MDRLITIPASQRRNPLTHKRLVPHPALVRLFLRE